MAKLTGPLMSIDARGSIAGALTFSAWKGRNYVRQLVTPANPKSPAQTAFRAMFGFLSRAWATLNDVQAGSQASWQALAEAGNYSAFNAFMRFNQDRWSRNLAPMPNSEGASVEGSNVTLASAVAGVKSIQVNITWPDDADVWGGILYRKAGGAPDGLQTEVIAVLPSINNSTQGYQDLGLTPGITYHYKIRGFLLNGGTSDLSSAVSATPT